MLKRKTGDLLSIARQGEFDVIVHGVNCFCTMGSGIARQIKEEYPEVYAMDKLTVKGDNHKIGTFNYVTTKDGFVIVNAYTQYDFNKYGTIIDKFEYVGFQRILNDLLKEFPDGTKFGFPYIGMGLAGGNKEKIIAMIEDFSQKVENQGGEVTLVEYADI